MNPLVSVVITTKNEEPNIENCLRSIKDQAYSNLEVIVVDNNSSDQTKEIAGQYTKLVFDLSKETDLIEIKNYRGAQLNFGVGRAKGEIIFFPDADMTFSKDLIMEATKKLKEFDALYVPEIICGKRLFGKIRNFERSFYNKTCIDGIRIIKKDLFLKVGGFDVKNIVFGPDDWDFTKTLKRINCNLEITDQVLYHHEEWLTLKVYLNKKSKYVSTFDGYVNKWGKNDNDIKKQLGFSYRYFGVFFENGKWKKIIKHPILSAGMYVIRFLVGLKFVFRS
ncbi:MAG: glycosyltransferase family A protein [Candidatus Falkowbacteria bacterium]|nr:glycosyltransferase family A protein [Candidatus Falkowbacteria bacterium]